MQKYRNYIIICILLAFLAVFYFIRDKKGTLKLNSQYFALTDTSEISKITIISDTAVVLLEKSGDNWVVNSKYNAKIRLIKGLMGLLTTMEIRSPVPKRMQSVVAEQFKYNSIRIKIESNFRIVKEFEVCDIDTLPIGTLIRKPGSNDVYIAKIPGYDNPVGVFFQTKELFWRENIVFRYKPWEMLKIEVEYPSSPRESFTLDLENPKKIELINKAYLKPVIVKKEDIVRYLMNFSAVPFYPVKGYRKSFSDSLKKITPLCIFKIKNIENQINVVKLYTIVSLNKKTDLFKMYAEIQNDTLPCYVKYIDFDPVMKKFQELSNQ